MLGQSGWGAPAQPDSLPNPNGPMTPNLVLVNPGPEGSLTFLDQKFFIGAQTQQPNRKKS